MKRIIAIHSQIYTVLPLHDNVNFDIKTFEPMSNQIRLYKIYCSVTPKFLDSTPISTVEILLSGFNMHRHILGRQWHSLYLTAAVLLPRWLSSKESACQCKRCRRRRLGISPGKGNGNSLQYSCLENPMDRLVWQATFHGVAKESDTT